MTTQLTPPPVSRPTPTAAPAPQTDTTRVGTRALSITIAVLGAGALVLGGLATAFGTVRQATSPDPVAQSVSGVSGVHGIDVDVSAGDLRIEFSGSEITLVSTGESGWTLERDGDRIEVSSPDDPFDLGFDWLWNDADRSATLTLPAALEGADLDIDLSAGRVIAEGEFGATTFEMSAGAIELEGSAETLDGSVSAGHAIVELADVREIDIDLSAGHLQGQLSGEAPERVGIGVSAGSLDLRLPDVPYAVRDDSGAGELHLNNLQEDSGASRQIDVRVAAGEVDLRAGG